jgi:hypothetical protein
MIILGIIFIEPLHFLPYGEADPPIFYTLGVLIACKSPTPSHLHSPQRERRKKTREMPQLPASRRLFSFLSKSCSAAWHLPSSIATHNILISSGRVYALMHSQQEKIAQHLDVANKSYASHRPEFIRDLAEWLELLTANVNVATVLGSIPAASDFAESEGRQMKQYQTLYMKSDLPGSLYQFLKLLSGTVL